MSHASRSVALLRGVNVGGHRKVSMVTLAQVFDDAGYTDVRTYIQSGNVVFSHGRTSTTALEADIERHIENAFGFDVDVIVRTGHELDAVIRANPYPPAQTHVAFLKRAAKVPTDDGRFAPEGYTASGTEVYFLLPNGIGRSRAPTVLNPLKLPVTVRNWRSVTKLAEMAGS